MITASIAIAGSLWDLLFDVAPPRVIPGLRFIGSGACSMSLFVARNAGRS